MGEREKFLFPFRRGTTKRVGEGSMRFFIEVERPGPEGTVLVTLRDGPTPKVGEELEDEAGDVWRVVNLCSIEVQLAPARHRTPKDIPKGMALVRAHSRHAAA